MEKELIWQITHIMEGIAVGMITEEDALEQISDTLHLYYLNTEEDKNV